VRAPSMQSKLHRNPKEEKLAIGNSEAISQDIASVDVSQLPMAQLSPPSATLAKELGSSGVQASVASKQSKLHMNQKEEKLAIGNSEAISQDIASVDVSQLPMARLSLPSRTLPKELESSWVQSSVDTLAAKPSPGKKARIPTSSGWLASRQWPLHRLSYCLGNGDAGHDLKAHPIFIDPWLPPPWQDLSSKNWWWDLFKV
jgi:hypothetical protein